MGLTNEEVDLIQSKNGNWFKNTYGKYFGKRNFKLPESYRNFLLHDLPENLDGKRLFSWYGTVKRIGKETRTYSRMWKYDLNDEQAMWLAIAEWSDYHTIWLCCDEGHDDYGTIRDTHDGHPWDPNHNWMPYDSFENFYQQWLDSYKPDE